MRRGLAEGVISRPRGTMWIMLPPHALDSPMRYPLGESPRLVRAHNSRSLAVNPKSYKSNSRQPRGGLGRLLLSQQKGGLAAQPLLRSWTLTLFSFCSMHTVATTGSLALSTGQ